MNRMIVRRIASNICGLRVARKTFCNDAAAELSGSRTSNELWNEHGSKNNVPQYDIAIVGGGMVGMALACSIASIPLTKQLTVAIIDSNPALGREGSFKKDDPPDSRVGTVTPATISFYKDIGAWQYVQQHRHAYFDKMQVWDYTGLGYIRYNARDADKEVLGCVVENKVLHRSLLSCIQNNDFQKTIYPSRLTSMTLSPSLSSVRVGVDGSSSGTTTSTCGGLAKLELSDGSSLYAKLVDSKQLGGSIHRMPSFVLWNTKWITSAHGNDFYLLVQLHFYQ